MNDSLEIKCSFKTQAEDKLTKGFPISRKDEECLYKCKGQQCPDYDGPRNKPVVSYSVR